MAWPQATDYAEAVQNLPTAFRDPDIRAGRAVTNALGLPLARTGNFAAVFEVASPTSRQKWAVKCFTRQVPGLKGRYQHIDAHLQQRRLSFMVPFRYLPRSVLVQGQWYPSLKMEWVEGLRLDEFLAECLTRRDYKSPLRTLCGMWVRMAQLLREAGVGHGDLQHGNVLLVRAASEQEAYKLRLVDYDGMYVPSLAGRASSEVGHPAYQHPQRLVQGGYGPEIDRFSNLLIYTTLQCLITGGPKLWDRHYDGDRLLIGEHDLEAPEKSPIFRRLWQLPVPVARHLVGHLILAAKGRLEDVPLLDQVVVHSKVVGLTGAQRQHVERWMSGTKVSQSPGGPTPTVERLPQWQDATQTPDWLAAELPLPPPLRPQARRASRHDFLLRNWRPASALAVSFLAIVVLFVTLLVAWRGPVPSGEQSLAADDAEPVGTSKLPAPAVAPFDVSGANEHQQSWARFLELPVEQTNSIGMKLVLIPPGDFLMGSSESEAVAVQHRVRISKPFYLGVYEVMQAEYRQVMGKNTSFFCADGGGKDEVQGMNTSRFPVEDVSWTDAVEFCRRLSQSAEEQRAGRTYRLPTEAEWEYACRAGTITPFHFGSQLSGGEANFDGTRPYGTYTKGPDLGRPTIVGSYRANAFGLYDMHGNVWEWCQDWYEGDYYSNSPESDPQGPSQASNRVTRGGSWGSFAINCRSADRRRVGPTLRGGNLGFRVAAVPSGK